MIRLIRVVLDGGIIKDLHVTTIARLPSQAAILRCSCCLGLVLVAGDDHRLSFLERQLIFEGLPTGAIRVRLAVEGVNEVERGRLLNLWVLLWLTPAELNVRLAQILIRGVLQHGGRVFHVHLLDGWL